MQRWEELCKKAWLNLTYHFFVDSDISIQYESLGRISTVCTRGCGAVHFPNDPNRYYCCDKAGLGSFLGCSGIPEQFLTLLQNKDFWVKIRHYNNTFQLATLEMMQNISMFVNHTFPFYIKVNGSLYQALLLYVLVVTNDHVSCKCM